MPGKRRPKVMLWVLGVLVPLGVTGCGDDADSGGASGTGSAAPAMRKLGGASSGFSVSVPGDWKEVDPSQDSSETVRTSFELTGPNGDMVKMLIARQKQQGVVFAIDTAGSGYAPHLEAGCDRGGITGASLEQLKAKTQALSPGAKITDVTVAGKPAFRAAYTTRQTDVTTETVEVRVPVAADRFCYATVEARQGGLPATTDRILGSFQPG